MIKKIQLIKNKSVRRVTLLDNTVINVPITGYPPEGSGVTYREINDFIKSNRGNGNVETVRTKTELGKMFSAAIARLNKTVEDTEGVSYFSKEINDILKEVNKSRNVMEDKHKAEWKKFVSEQATIVAAMIEDEDPETYNYIKSISRLDVKQVMKKGVRTLSMFTPTPQRGVRR